MTRDEALARWRGMQPGIKVAANLLNPLPAASHFNGALDFMPGIRNFRPTALPKPPPTFGQDAANTFWHGPMEGAKFIGHSLFGTGAFPSHGMTPRQIAGRPAQGPGILENVGTALMETAAGRGASLPPLSEIWRGPIQRAMPHAERYQDLTSSLGRRAWEPVEAFRKWWNEPGVVY